MCSDWRTSVFGITSKLSHIRGKGLFTDVCFRVGQNKDDTEIIKAHKLILITCSSVFEAMFTGPYTEATNAQMANEDLEFAINIPDINPMAFKTMLKFIYGNDLPNDIGVPIILEVLYASKKYNIFDLVETCWERLMENITVENVVSVYQTAQLYDDFCLRDEASKFLKKNFDKVLEESDDFLNFSSENLEEFLKEEDTCISNELSLFKAITRWSISECDLQNLEHTSQNKRLVLGNIVKLINFMKISVADIALIVVPTGILTEFESTLLLQHKCALDKSPELELPKLEFSSIERKAGCLMEHVVKFHGSYCGPLDLSKEYNGFTFRTNKPVEIVGCSFLNHPFLCEGIVLDVTMCLVEASKCRFLSSICRSVNPGKNAMFTINFENPVPITPNDLHLLRFKIKGPPLPCLSNSPMTVESYGVSFNIEVENYTSLPDSNTTQSVTLPEIRFRIP